MLRDGIDLRKDLAAELEHCRTKQVSQAACASPSHSCYCTKAHAGRAAHQSKDALTFDSSPCAHAIANPVHAVLARFVGTCVKGVQVKAARQHKGLLRRGERTSTEGRGLPPHLAREAAQSQLTLQQAWLPEPAP